MKRPPTDKDFKTALKILDKLANPKGNWRDDEARRVAKQFLKKWKEAT